MLDTYSSGHNHKELGYSFQPKQCDEPGCPRLEIILHGKPTGKHFDPERVLLTVAETTIPENAIEHLSIHHNWHGKQNYRVCAGSVRMTDRYGKSVDAYIFGGDLQIEAGQEKTIVSLSSPAPILELSQGYTSTLADMLAAEVEVLLARRRAFWTRHNPAEYERRLAVVEPLALYHTCIDTLKERFRSFPCDGQANTLKALKCFLQDESQKLIEQRSQLPSPLADIL